MGFWHAYMGIEGGGGISATVENVTTRLTLVGTSKRRLAVTGTSAERMNVTGTSQKRLTIEGASR